MATITFYSDFAEQLALGQHNLQTNTLRAALSNTAPNVTHTLFSQVGEIAAGNGYVAGGLDIQNTLTQVTSQAVIDATDVVWTASGGNIATFRYVVIYNQTASGRLVAFYDHGSAVDLTDGSSFTVDFPTGWLSIG